MKTDIEVRKDVLEELAWEPRLDESRLAVEVRNGVATLDGQVDSLAEKLAARRAALRVAGVRAVALNIEVRVPAAHQRTDTQIAEAAAMALGWNSTVPKNAVQVTVEDGILTLTGELVAAFQRHAAEKAVSNLLGVKAVENRILVKPSVLPKDIQSKIAAALHRQAQKDVQHLDIVVEGGTVTLKGTLSSSAERHAAVHAAWSAPGVAHVVDLMEVDTQQPGSP